MNRSTTDQGQRVDVPDAVTGDTPAGGEPDPTELREGMADAARGSDAKLKDKEDRAEEDATAVEPDHRENDAGQ